MSYMCNVVAGAFYAKEAAAVKKILSILHNLGIDSEEYPKGSLVIDVHSSRSLNYDESDYYDIAPLCAKESYLDFIGEDYNIWSLVFRGGKQYDVSGKAEWRPGPERIVVPLDDGYSIEAEQNGDPGRYREIAVSLIGPDGNAVQDLAIIGEKYRYEGDTVVPLHGQYSVKVWTDPNNENWQTEHLISRFDEYEERCRDCASRTEGDDNSWICGQCGRNIRDVSFSECEPVVWTDDVGAEPVKGQIKDCVHETHYPWDGSSCCICGGPIDWGNDPWPVSKDPKAFCWNKCNSTVVIPERIKLLKDEKRNHSYNDVFCKVMSTDEFEYILDKIYEKPVSVDYSLDGIFIEDPDDPNRGPVDAEDLHKKLADVLNVGAVTSIHIDDQEFTGVWIACKDGDHKKPGLDCCSMQPVDAE